ncbi:MAG: hypothetical protein UIB63_06065, partial [Methanobrevibacter sp.]|uniref:hypothetical protein n=1 Tax=Methanobrevibacter sp. TaxID=66852 RepID=UPI002E795F14
MDFCPECGSMVFGDKCSMCGWSSGDLTFNQFIIGVPDEYILNKKEFKNDYDKLSNLIINKNQLDLTKEDILSNANKIINNANENFINYEKNLLIKDLTNTLNVINSYIDNNKKLKLKSQYNLSYFNYYDEFNFESKIDLFNKNIINKQKKCILKEFNEILNSKNEYIFEQEKLDFKSKYTFDYFNF